MSILHFELRFEMGICVKIKTLTSRPQPPILGAIGHLTDLWSTDLWFTDLDLQILVMAPLSAHVPPELGVRGRFVRISDIESVI
jgi:hypothetical protein